MTGYLWESIGTYYFFESFLLSSKIIEIFTFACVFLVIDWFVNLTDEILKNYFYILSNKFSSLLPN